jgi:hypothetical protein
VISLVCVIDLEFLICRNADLKFNISLSLVKKTQKIHYDQCHPS